MNKFHLLSPQEEDEHELVAAVASVAITAEKPSPANKAHPRDAHTKMAEPKGDRRSRSAPKGEGEKHQNVGKGSWGREGEAQLEVVAEDATAIESAEEPVAPAAPRVNYKTVKEYLSEQEEKARQLKSRSEIKTRKANEGIEVDSSLEVVKKVDEVFTVNAKKITVAPSQTVQRGHNKMSLQELNQHIPLAVVPRRERPSSDERRPREDRRVRENRPAGENGERRPRENRPSNENSEYRPRRDNGPRITDANGAVVGVKGENKGTNRPRRDGAPRRDGNAKNFVPRENKIHNKGSSFDINDLNSFPTLA